MIVGARFASHVAAAMSLAVAAVPTPIRAQPPEPPPVEIQVGDNMRFTPAAITVRPGERVRVALRGVGKIPKTAMAHNFVLLARGTDAKSFVDRGSNARETGFIAPALRDRVIAATALVGPGETVEVAFDAPDRPGEYTFVCTFPGHFKLGMKGLILVK